MLSYIIFVWETYDSFYQPYISIAICFYKLWDAEKCFRLNIVKDIQDASSCSRTLSRLMYDIWMC